MISYFLTAILNFFSFLSLGVTTSSESSFLAATFIFSASLLSEAMSISDSNKSNASKIISILIIAQGAIGVVGMVFSATGLFQFLNVVFERKEKVYILVTTYLSSIYYIPPVEINCVVVACGIISIIIPIWLGIREKLLQIFRKSHYNLNQGLIGK